MMTKYISILLCLFFCFQINLSAQVPGYQGKRGFFEYDLGYFITAEKPTAKGKYLSNYDGGFPPMNVKHEFTFSYVLSRKRSVGLTMDIFKTGLNLPYNQDEPNLNFSTLSVSAIGIVTDGVVLKMGGLAPYGVYNRFSIKRVNATVDEPSITNNKFSFWCLGYGLGFRKIFSKRFIFNVRGGFQLVLEGGSVFDSMESAVHERLLGHYTFESSLGIGILLF